MHDTTSMVPLRARSSETPRGDQTGVDVPAREVPEGQGHERNPHVFPDLRQAEAALLLEIFRDPEVQEVRDGIGAHTPRARMQAQASGSGSRLGASGYLLRALGTLSLTAFTQGSVGSFPARSNAGASRRAADRRLAHTATHTNPSAPVTTKAARHP